MAATALVAAPAAGLFAGATLLIGLVEHPARVACGPESAVQESPPRDRRAAPMPATPAAIATGAGRGRSLEAGSPGWRVAGLSIGTVTPFTLLVIRPANARPPDGAAHRAMSEPGERLTRRGRPPAVRGAAAVALVPVPARRAHR